MKNSTAYYDEEQELFEEEQERRDKKARRKKVQRVIDRIFGFILATGILFGVSGLAVEYVLVKGPSPALRNMFVNTMLETRRFGFIANVYLSEAEIDAIKQAKQSTLTDTTDTSLIKLPGQSGTETGGDNQTGPAQPDGTDGYGLVDDDGDGIIIEQVRKKGINVDGALVVHSTGEALDAAEDFEQCFVIGGASVYMQFFNYLERVYVTKIDTEPQSDSFFPNLDRNPEWECVSQEPWEEEDGIRYCFCTYEKKFSL